MKTSLRHLTSVGVFGIVLTLTSCVSPYYGYGPGPQNGAVVGALGGAGVGGIIGNQRGRGLEGAAIGALLGGLAGSALSQPAYYRGNNGFYGHPAPVGYGNFGANCGTPFGFNRPFYGGGFGNGYNNGFGGGGFGGRGFGGGRSCW